MECLALSNEDMNMHMRARDQSRNLRRNRKNVFQIIGSQWRLFLMISPAVVLLLIFNYLPMAGVLIAWKEYDFGKGILGSSWAGWKYFSYVLRPDFWEIMYNTLAISLRKFIFGFPAPIILALMINNVRNRFFSRTVQSLFYLPYFLSWVVVAGLLQTVMAYEGGLLNSILALFGADPVLFLGERDLFYPIIVLSAIWKGTGWGTIIYLAAITNINPELYDAAMIDGANEFKQTLHITLPSLIPVISILLVLSMPALISTGFDQIYLLQNAYNIKISEVIETYVLKLGLLNSQFSYATAIGIFTSITGTIFLLISNFASKKLGGEGIW
jgi:putative aldouronate transport system permease protein